MFVQIWGEQKHPDPSKADMSMTTKEYFDKEKEKAESNLAGKMREKVRIDSLISIRKIFES